MAVASEFRVLLGSDPEFATKLSAQRHQNWAMGSAVTSLICAV